MIKNETGEDYKKVLTCIINLDLLLSVISKHYFILFEAWMFSGLLTGCRMDCAQRSLCQADELLQEANAII